jgi:hypothetical protein
MDNPMPKIGSWQNARATGGAGILPAANLRSWYLGHGTEILLRG